MSLRNIVLALSSLLIINTAYGLEGRMYKKHSTPIAVADKTLRILINPGHGPYDGVTKNFGTQNGRFFEFDASMQVSGFLEILLREDSIHAELSKSWTEYNPDLKSYINKNISFLNKLVPGANVRMGHSVSNPDSQISTIRISQLYVDEKDKDYKTEKAKTYAERIVGQSLYDIVLNIHFNFADRRPRSQRKKPITAYTDRGYCILISPYNKRFKETFDLAQRISEELSNISMPSTSIVDDASLYRASRLGPKQISEMHLRGIRLSSMAQIGDAQIQAVKPVLTIECGHFRNFTNDDYYEFYKLAEAIYSGIKSYNEHPIK